MAFGRVLWGGHGCGMDMRWDVVFFGEFFFMKPKIVRLQSVIEADLYNTEIATQSIHCRYDGAIFYFYSL